MKIEEIYHVFFLSEKILIKIACCSKWFPIGEP